ncbi:hypothetical protein [uncultured Campylobacter sp.]|uniref:hypothetical protein n=1 Tax=uncultured Campylobacter sp. TaxID=218934 RepID=UPI002639FCDB|nr:hypothetical protein [uncultured Campylobacter sp.]
MRFILAAAPYSSLAATLCRYALKFRVELHRASADFTKARSLNSATEPLWFKA